MRIYKPSSCENIRHGRIPEEASIGGIAVQGERGSEAFISFRRHLPSRLATILTDIEKARFAINRGVLFHKVMTAIGGSGITTFRTIKPRANQMIKLPTIGLAPAKEFNAININAGRTGRNNKKRKKDCKSRNK